jgi:hypothetical protein
MLKFSNWRLRNLKSLSKNSIFVCFIGSFIATVCISVKFILDLYQLSSEKLTTEIFFSISNWRENSEKIDCDIKLFYVCFLTIYPIPFSVFKNLLNYNILLKVLIVTLKGTLKHAKMSVKEC